MQEAAFGTPACVHACPHSHTAGVTASSERPFQKKRPVMYLPQSMAHTDAAALGNATGTDCKVVNNC